MARFYDEHSRPWEVKVTVGSAKRVRSMTGVDVLKILDQPEILSEVAADPIRFVDVLYALCKPEADRLELSEDDFHEALAGESIEKAVDAFLEALVSFFPPARRKALERILTKAGEHQQRQTKALDAMLDDGTLDKALDQAMQQMDPTAGETSGKSPDPPALTPTG